MMIILRLQREHETNFIMLVYVRFQIIVMGTLTKFSKASQLLPVLITDGLRSKHSDQGSGDVFDYSVWQR